MRITFVLILYVLLIGNCRADEPISPYTNGIVKQKPQSGRSVKIDVGYMVPYKQRIPGTDQVIWMEPIPGQSEVKPKPSNPNATKPKLTAPFWMARYETRHADYLPYMRLYGVFKTLEAKRIRQVTDRNLIDAVTAPTEIYDVSQAFEFGMEMQHPVGTMTLFSARQYTKWLSRLTQQQFRLPTESEWEHACRAGTDTAWHCGDDPTVLSQYACFDNSKKHPGYQFVGLRKPSPWGLYDMHGNMAEWVLQPGVTKPDRQILKGGCWEFPAERCRSDSVLKFVDKTFRDYDPNIPQSPWWLASDDARWVGFRFTRPLKPMSKAEQNFAWECHSKDEQYAVKACLEEGRGTRGLVDPQLPAVIKILNAEEAK